MESGLEDRNNNGARTATAASLLVSMESGLEDRNNVRDARAHMEIRLSVSMESGLEDRNNPLMSHTYGRTIKCLNGVRPRRPEQSENVGGQHVRKKMSQWSPA